jgi:cell division protein FtsN
MSRDLKPRRTPGKKKSGGGTLLGLFFGLVIGVLCAAGVVWFINKMPTPFTAKGQEPVVPATAKLLPQDVQAPALLPGKPGDPIPQNGDKPRFDFYKILPGNAEAIPDPKPDDKPADSAKNEKEGGLKEPLYLQVGSFQNVSDADNQKAKLALIGIEAAIQQVMVQDKVWFRVRLGPFTRMDEINRTRADLIKQGVDANVVKKD